MELPVEGKIPFVGMEMRKHGSKVETQVYRKPTEAFNRLRSIFVGLDYSIVLIDSTIQKVVRNSLNGDPRNSDMSD